MSLISIEACCGQAQTFKHSNIQNFKHTVILGQNLYLLSIKLSQWSVVTISIVYFAFRGWPKIQIRQNTSLTQLNTK
jgi:hypothetical protein